MDFIGAIFVSSGLMMLFTISIIIQNKMSKSHAERQRRYVRRKRAEFISYGIYAGMLITLAVYFL